MWPVALLAAIAVPATPPAAGTPCAPAPPKPPAPKLSAFERKVRDGMGVRRGYGLRADRAWVVRVLRSPRSRFDLGFGPASPGELRYLRFRDRVIEASKVIAAHLRRQPVDVDAGYDVEDAGQRGGPFLIYKLAGDRARLEPELRARYPYPRHLRFKDADYSVRELKALSTRVFDDSEELEREGFFVDNGGPDTSANRARIGVITSRTDAQEFFAARYGPGVTVEVIAAERDRLVCTRASAFRARRGGRVLELVWTTNSVYEVVRVEVAESADAVRVGIVERAPSGSVTDAARNFRRRIRLAAPLGSRAVLHARRDRPILRCAPGSRPRDIRDRLECLRLGVRR